MLLVDVMSTGDTETRSPGRRRCRQRQTSNGLDFDEHEDTRSCSKTQTQDMRQVTATQVREKIVKQMLIFPRH